ncbi:MAG: DUF302 domain-containing protein [Pseudomonas sp.]
MTIGQDNGLVSYLSRYSFESTLTILEGAILKSGTTVYAKIDHAKGAHSLSETMPPCTLLIFGHPKGGTPLMLQNPVIGIDLPLKLLAWQDPKGLTWVTVTELTYLAKRHSINERSTSYLCDFFDVLVAEIS